MRFGVMTEGLLESSCRLDHSIWGWWQHSYCAFTACDFQLPAASCLLCKHDTCTTDPKGPLKHTWHAVTA